MCVAGELAQAQGDHDRAVELSQQAHKVFQEIGDDRGTAAALNTLGLDALVQGDYSNAAMLLKDSLERFRSVGDARASSWSLRHLSSLAFRRGDVVQCTVLAEEGLRIAQAAGNRLDIARFLLNLSNAAVTLGRLDQAQAQAEECLALFRESGDRWGVAVALERLGHAAFERGDAVQALALLETSLEMFREIGDPEGTALVLMRLGWLERSQGHGATETKRFMEGMAIARERRLSSLIAWTQLGQGAVALDRGNVADAARAWRESLALAAGVQDHVATATILDWSAHLAFAGNAAAGARVIGAVCALRDTLEVPKQASMRASHERLYDALQATLGTGEYTSHVRSGADLSLDAAIAEANEILSLAMSRAQAESPIGVHEASRSAQPGSPTKAPAGLSSREVEVLRLVAQGYSDQDIATALFISRRTASTHVQHIFNKLGVSSRAAAAAWAVHNGLA
jgi:ATP/maltotriose-dependent transcriptional regulator MalT